MDQVRYFDKLSSRKKLTGNKKEQEVPYLISLQKDSYKKLLNSTSEPSESYVGIESVFRSFFPVTDSVGKVTLEFVEYLLSDPLYSPAECISSSRTYASSLKAKLRLILWDTNSDDPDNKEVLSIKEQEVYLCELPLMTENGSFIINGSERVIVSQMKRSPGVFFGSESGSNVFGSKIYTAKIVPNIGSWLDFEIDNKDILHFRIDKKRKMLVTSLLRALDFSSKDIITSFYNKFKIHFDKKKGWISEFVPELFLDTKASTDIIDADTGDVVIKKGKKINQRLVDKITDAGFKNYILIDELVFGHVIVDDLLDSDTGEVLLESGSMLTNEALDALQNLNFDNIDAVNPSKSRIGSYIYNTLIIDKNKTTKDALLDIYRSIRLGESLASVEVASNFLNSLFFNVGKYNLSDVGRMKINYRLGLDIDKNTLHLTKEDIIKTIEIISKIKYNDLPTDDIDNLANRRVRAVGELVENQLRIGISKIEKYILEKMHSADADSIMPQTLINSKPLSSSIKDFFAMSQLSQFMDQTNPLSEVTHKRRLSSLGPGGLVRDRAGFEVRDVHPTHYGRICPIETPEGPNIGLINSLATYARINNYGFVETPYRKLVDGKVGNEVVFLSAIEEIDKNIAQSSIEVNEDGSIAEDIVVCRRNNEYITIKSAEIDLIDVSTRQLISIATTLIPFLENDDANRALMGSNMQRQALPLLKSSAPLVGTGTESIIAYDSGVIIKSDFDGVIRYVDATKIIVESSDENNIGKIKTYDLIKYSRTNQDTCINQKPIVSVGDSVKAGQVMSDGHAVENGELALGKNIRVAFMSWNGYNFEDSIIVSEKLLQDNTFTSVHIEELEIVARDTRLGPEEITRDIPNINEEYLGKLDEEGIIHIGAKIKAGDLIVGKTTPKSESPMTPEEKLLKVIFGEKSSDVKDSSLYAPIGMDGVVVDVKVLSRKGLDKDERSLYIESQDIQKATRNKDAQIAFLKNSIGNKLRSILFGQKLLNNIGKKKKGTELDYNILQEFSVDELLKTSVEDVKIAEKSAAIVKNYKEQLLSIQKEYDDNVSRIKSGDDLKQGVLKIVKVYIASRSVLQAGDKMSGRHGNKGVVSKIVPIEDMPYDENGEPVDIILNPLGVPSRMNIGQILESHLGLASVTLGRKVAEILDLYYKKGATIADVKSQLSKIYDSKEELSLLKSMNDEEIVEFAEKIRNGVPFATGSFDGMNEQTIDNLLTLSGNTADGQVKLIDGISGEAFDRKVTVGYMYILKLHHLVDSKIHARSIGPYSLITQQPLGGKSHFGGQRFGEMECWALQAYGVAYTLQEMLTVKSDDVVGRIKIYESIIHDNQNFTCGIPESFNVMIKEVRSLGLNIELVD
ncbi:DNA-directed RNA polymerase subunit beta [Rickettsiales bacterium]|nr:DNA-directed RNA polymerase subunit beta [Rickettsiales bacterium]